MANVFEDGNDVDFDQLNEQNLKNVPTYELVRAANVILIFFTIWTHVRLI